MFTVAEPHQWLQALLLSFALVLQRPVSLFDTQYPAHITAPWKEMERNPEV